MDGNRKLFHINLLKKYFNRNELNFQASGVAENITCNNSLYLAGYFELVRGAGLDNEDNAITDSEEDIVCMPSCQQKEYVENVKISPDLNPQQKVF